MGMKKILVIQIGLVVWTHGYCQTWMPLGNGVSWEGGAISSTVLGILGDTVNHVLYVDGHFDTADNVPALHCANWNGVIWSDMSISDDAVGQFLTFNGELYNAGEQVYRWNGSDWNMVDPYFDDLLGYLIEYDGRLLAGGTFTHAGAFSAKGLAFLGNNDHWHPFPGGGVTNYGAYSGGAYIGAMAIYNGDLIVAGKFDSAGGVLCNNIARWDGSQWHSLDSGTSGPCTGCETVFELGVYDGFLYASGSFYYAGGTYCLGFAKWDGNQWFAVDTNLNFFPRSFKNYYGLLYAGGASANGATVRKFDGLTWSDVGIYSGGVNSIEILDNILYAGGSFVIYTPTDTIHNIAMLDIATGEWKPVLLDDQWAISPNPVSSSLQMTYTIHQPATITITNTYGSVVKQLTLYPYFKNRIVYVDDLAAGIYLVTMREGNKISSKKVVVER